MGEAHVNHHLHNIWTIHLRFRRVTQKTETITIRASVCWSSTPSNAWFLVALAILTAALSRAMYQVEMNQHVFILPTYWTPPLLTFEPAIDVEPMWHTR